MSSREFIARIHNEDDGSLWAEVLDLPGCFASGDNLDELREALEEAISMYMADEFEVGPGGKSTRTHSRHLEVDEMRVKVPA